MNKKTAIIIVESCGVSACHDVCVHACVCVCVCVCVDQNTHNICTHVHTYRAQLPTHMYAHHKFQLCPDWSVQRKVQEKLQEAALAGSDL